MMVSVSSVWTGYRALHRYIRDRTPPIGAPLQCPRQLPLTPLPKHLPTCQNIADLLTRLDASTPAPLTSEYYAYLYLFIQAIRCSLRFGPTWTPQGWANLAWFPLRSLSGRPGIGERTWIGWYKQHIVSQRWHLDNLTQHYPMLPEEDQTALVHLQRRTFLDFGGTAEVFKTKDPLGFPAHGALLWSSWLMMATPEAWLDPELRIILFPKFWKLVMSESWPLFVKQCVTDSTRLVGILDHQLSQADLSVKKRWRRARRYLLPVPGRERDRRTVPIRTR